MLAGKAHGMLLSCRRMAASSLSSTQFTSFGQSLVRCHSAGPNDGNGDHGLQRATTARRQFSTSSRNASTTTSPQQQREANETTEFHPIYVHHVSRVALEHLQDTRSDWLVARGLDRNLKIRNNGTFLLNFPEYGRIWTSYDSERRQHWLSVYRHKLAVRFLLKDHDHAAQRLHEHQQQQVQPSVADVQEFHASSVRKIQHAVDDMIRSVESIESKKQEAQKS